MFGIMRTKFAIGTKRLIRTVSPRRFLRREDGSVAVEFSIVMVPFFAVMFAIMETALVFFAGQTLETVAADAGRQIMTGQAQPHNYSLSDFKTHEVCARIYGLFNCGSSVYVNVQTYANFGSISYTPTLDGNGNLVTSGFGYNPGGPGDIVVVQLFYQWPLPSFVSNLGINLSNMRNGTRLLVATAAFKNEPYN
jgi:Flp pilus assembly protein TadG